jgi:hypothetical protein
MRAIIQALPVLGLTEEKQAAIARNAEVIEGELARSKPEQAIVKPMHAHR